jgi:hypothetical protein
VIDDLHHLVRLHLHDDMRWSFGVDDAIELRPYFPDRGPDERLDRLARKLGFEASGNGVWRVAASSPHYEDLWVFVEQERLEGEEMRGE